MNGQVLGSGVFFTHSGLIAEGNGELSGLSNSSELVDLTDQLNNEEHLPPDQSESWFLRAVSSDGERRWLLGLVRSHLDFTRRKGCFGVCFLLPWGFKSNHDLVEGLRSLYDQFGDYYDKNISSAGKLKVIGFLIDSVAERRLESFDDEHRFQFFGPSIAGPDEPGLDLMRAYLLQRPPGVSAVFVWAMAGKGRDDLPPPLSQNNVDAAKRFRIEAEQALEQVRISHEESERFEAERMFHQNTKVLGHVRPNSVDAQTERYIIEVLNAYRGRKLVGIDRVPDREEAEDQNAPTKARSIATPFVHDKKGMFRSKKNASGSRNANGHPESNAGRFRPGNVLDRREDAFRKKPAAVSPSNWILPVVMMFAVVLLLGAIIMLISDYQSDDTLSVGQEGIVSYPENRENHTDSVLEIPADVEDTEAASGDEAEQDTDVVPHSTDDIFKKLDTD